MMSKWTIEATPDEISILADCSQSKITPERTCKWVWLEEWRDDEDAGHECQYAGWGLNCGCFDGNPLDEYDDFDKKPDNEWQFCPWCGAEVVDDD